jgi:hypothetical protein
MLTMLTRLTVWNTNNKKAFSLSWLTGTPYTGTQMNFPEKHIIMYRQPASQALDTSVRVY